MNKLHGFLSLFPSWMLPHAPRAEPETAKPKVAPIKKPRGRPKNPHLAERDAKFPEQYREGKTLAEIGRDHGISRERVRQVLFAMGVRGGDGGRFGRSKGVA